MRGQYVFMIFGLAFSQLLISTTAKVEVGRKIIDNLILNFSLINRKVENPFYYR